MKRFSCRTFWNLGLRDACIKMSSDRRLCINFLYSQFLKSGSLSKSHGKCFNHSKSGNKNQRRTCLMFLRTVELALLATKRLLNKIFAIKYTKHVAIQILGNNLIKFFFHIRLRVCQLKGQTKNSQKIYPRTFFSTKALFI